MGTTDAALVRGAQSGDATSLGILLNRHRAGMHMVALSLLGHGPDAEDAVQEAMVIALRRIGDVGDPEAAGPWLKAIVRNVCRTQLRRARPMTPVTTEPSVAGPEEALERAALGDWVWHAVGQLSPALREVIVLRHFTDMHHYDQIAAACGIPIGTVRSRLSQARAKLAEALIATADRAHDDAAARAAARQREAEEIFAALRAGRADPLLRELYSPAVDSDWPSGRRRRGVDAVLRVVDSDMAAGVRHFLTRVVAAPDLLIWEGDFINPPSDPAHCPPAAAWVHTLTGGRVTRLRIFHHPRGEDRTSRPLAAS